MGKLGKSVSLYLMDREASGRMRCKLSSWNAIGYKIPRIMLKESRALDGMNTPGIYFLFGQDDDSDTPFVYVGEADDVISRLLQPHTFEKDGSYWTEAVVFVTPDNTLEKGRVKYLENRFYNIITNAGRYVCKNGNTPKKSPVDPAIEDMLEEFILNVEIVMPTMGYDVLEAAPSDEDRSNLFYFSRNKGKGGNATGKLASDGFWVLKGSYIAPDIADYLPEGVKRGREKYAKFIDEKGILQKDIRFGSPSYASSFVCGKSSNGLVEWKNGDGVTLKALDTSTSKSVKLPGAAPTPVHISMPEKQKPIEKPRKLVENSQEQPKGILLHLAGKVKAHAVMNGDSFVVLKGSEYKPTESASCPASIRGRRKTMIENGQVQNNVFIQDVIFTSSSTAAACVLGGSKNGLITWRTEDGKKLAEVIKN